MGFFDIFGGGPFDFNGDGHTGSDEMAFGFMMLDDIQRKEKERKKQEFVIELTAETRFWYSKTVS